MSARAPAIAFGGTGNLAVWADTCDSNDSDICAAWIGVDG
jgi:hypothetical protein